MEETKKLALSEGFWPMLALDHGLTALSEAVALELVPSLLSNCSNYFSGVVMTYGIARSFQVPTNQSLILQCFGAPSGVPKAQVCSIDMATRLQASGVALQVEFELPKDDLAHQIRSISSFVGQAHDARLPVLFMIAHSASATLETLLERIRVCHELGADLIKIRCDEAMLDASGERVSSKAPPVLLAGGKHNGSIAAEVAKSKRLGFAGYCVGRNVYQSPKPEHAAQLLYDTWKATS